MKICGIEFSFDFLDADKVELFEQGITDIKDRVSDPAQYQGLSNAEAMRKQCEMIDDFFDNLLGDGAAEQLFTSAGNLGERLDAFGQLIEASTAARQQINDIALKYNPAYSPNRAMRRAADHLAPGGKVRTFRGMNGESDN